MFRSMKIISKMAGLLLVIALFLADRAWSAPTTRPLEHSPSDLAWDAWLQQGSRQAPPPRRITTKSLFVFPQLGPDSLPPCAEGYRPDAMGRCVKVVKVDETAHLEFLLQKLNSQFATETSGGGQDESYDYETETDAPDSNGPFQFNIPIALQIKASKPDDPESSGEVAQIVKKTPQKTAPTSSPEVVPEYNSDKNQFFLDSAPAESQNVLSKNDSSAAGPVSILIRNSTTSGVTLILSSNGKFENLTAQSGDGEKLLDELENVKLNGTGHETVEKNIVKKSAELAITDNLQESENNTVKTQKIDEVIDEKTIPTERTELAPENLILKNNQSIPIISTETSEDDVRIIQNNDDNKMEIDSNEDIDTTDSHANDTVSETEVFVGEIELLKKDPPKYFPLKSNNIQPIEVKNASEIGGNVHNSTDAGVTGKPNQEQNILFHKPNILPASDFELDKELGIIPSGNPHNDFEEKIKLISRYADVSRNTDSNEGALQKKSPENVIKFPNESPSANNVNEGLKMPVLSPSSLNTLKFPFDSVQPQNLMTSQQIPYSIEYNNGNHPLLEIPKQRLPYWWPPYGWNVRNSAEEREFMDFISKGPPVQEYPFDVRLEHERHPSHYQTLYPGSHHSEGRLNVRHTAVNHRRGRFNKKRQIQLEDLMTYKRGRHPHFRESGEQLDSQHAFNGR